MPTRKGGQEYSDRLVVELVGENDFAAVLNYRLVISCMDSTGYWER